MEEDEIIIEESKKTTKDEFDFDYEEEDVDTKTLIASAFKKYFSLGLIILAIMVRFIAEFVLACGSYSGCQWISLIVYALVGLSIIIELFNVIKNKKFDYKGTIIPVLAVAIILI